MNEIKKNELRTQFVKKIQDDLNDNVIKPINILYAFIEYFDNFKNFEDNYLLYINISNYYNASKRFINKYIKYIIFNREKFVDNYVEWAVEYFIRSYKKNGFKNDKAFNKELRELKDLFKD